MLLVAELELKEWRHNPNRQVGEYETEEVRWNRQTAVHEEHLGKQSNKFLWIMAESEPIIEKQHIFGVVEQRVSPVDTDQSGVSIQPYKC